MSYTEPFSTPRDKPRSSWPNNHENHGRISLITYIDTILYLNITRYLEDVREVAACEICTATKWKIQLTQRNLDQSSTIPRNHQILWRYKQKLDTVAVLLNVSKDFDRVWNGGLPYKLANSPFSVPTMRLLWWYLCGRTFYISTDGALSSQSPIDAGAVLGSFLSPVLSLMYMNNMPLYRWNHLISICSQCHIPLQLAKHSLSEPSVTTITWSFAPRRGSGPLQSMRINLKLFASRAEILPHAFP